MFEIKLTALSIILCLTANNVNAADPDKEIQYIDDGLVQYYCNTKTSDFYFDADSIKPPTGLKKQNVNITSLLIQSKEDSYGNKIRLGSKKNIRKCGAIKLVFESGFYNSNPQGLLGLMDYPLLSIFINNKNITNKTPLNLCNSSGLRSVCPTEFSIQSVKISQNSKGSYKVVLTKAFHQDSDNTKFKEALFFVKSQ